MTREEAIKILAILSAAYPNFSLPKATGELYIKMLTDIPAKLGEAAALAHIAESQYYPTVAELRTKALKFATQDALPQSGEAWGEVVREIKRVGSYGTPQFSHDAIKKAVDAVGWKNICLSTDPGVERAHFMRIYEQLRAREEEQALIPAKVKELMAGTVKQLHAANRDHGLNSVSEILPRAVGDDYGGP
jgi:hypothetical protein